MAVILLQSQIWALLSLAFKIEELDGRIGILREKEDRTPVKLPLEKE